MSHCQCSRYNIRTSVHSIITLYQSKPVELCIEHNQHGVSGQSPNGVFD